MNSKEFKQFVLENAKKIIFENNDLDEVNKILKQPKSPKSPKQPKSKKQPKSPKSPKSPKIVKTKTVANEESLMEKNINENFCSPEKIKTLVEEMKKVNKKIDLRNPLISPELFEIISKETDFIETKNKRWENLCEYERKNN
ncbi:MAG: hypothetical protein WC466_09990 [Candidatus Izemoplasmatales bacterium]